MHEIRHIAFLEIKKKVQGANHFSDLEMPEHDLEPPKFGRRALERILNDWTAVKAMINSGQKQTNIGYDVLPHSCTVDCIFIL